MHNNMAPGLPPQARPSPMMPPSSSSQVRTLIEYVIDNKQFQISRKLLHIKLLLFCSLHSVYFFQISNGMNAMHISQPRGPAPNVSDLNIVAFVLSQ